MDQSVLFDVGHSIHRCDKKTIDKYPDSMLAGMIRNSEPTDSAETMISIDRDGRLFGKILDFMRDERLLKLGEMDRQSIKLLLKESKYYLLDRLIQVCEDELMNKDSSFITHFRIIHSEQELSRFIQSSKKLIILISFEQFVISSDGTEQLHECLPMLDSDKAEIVGFTCELKQLGDFKGEVGLYDPGSGKFLELTDQDSDYCLLSILPLINKYEFVQADEGQAVEVVGAADASS